VSIDGPLSHDARVVVVGASLAGQRAAERLRIEGFRGRITMIGDEAHEAYDRPPLSKQVLLGLAPAHKTRLPRLVDLAAGGEVEWRLGVAAVGLDRRAREVRLADDSAVPYDRLLIATGVRNRPWFVPEQAALDGVASVRTSDDSARLRTLLEAGPRRVLVIGGGFTGSEIASVCRQLDLDVTLTDRGPAPLSNVFGEVVGAIAAEIQMEHGVDLRTGVHVEDLEGDASGRVRGAVLSDGSTVEAEVVVVALGAPRHVEWLDGAGLAAGPLGVAADAGCRAINQDGLVVDDIFVAGDVARVPHPLYGYEFLSLEHWENAIAQADIAAHNMVCAPVDRLPHVTVPAFWSIQFGINIKSVGVPPFADEILFTEGSVKDRSFVAAYGQRGRLVGAALFDQAKSLDFYRREIENAAALPAAMRVVDGLTPDGPVSPRFPHPSVPSAPPTVVLSGYAPDERHATIIEPQGAS
jgi:3-phenylpropionate/trans-cinnamate dioxygenase ferredoxin reductase subunit